MAKLLRYELRKTRGAKLLMAGLMLAAEVVFLLGVARLRLGKGDNGLLPLGLFLLVSLSWGSLMVIGLQTVLTLHRDLTTRQSYMLFMTPHGGYEILGAKVLENGLSLLLAGLVIGALAMLDLTLLLAASGELSALLQMISSLLGDLAAALPLRASSVAMLFGGMLLLWLGVIVSACFAVILSAALFAGRRGGTFISFLLFLVLVNLTSWVQLRLPALLLPAHWEMITHLPQYTALFAILSLACTALQYALGARIMERRLSV